MPILNNADLLKRLSTLRENKATLERSLENHKKHSVIELGSHYFKDPKLMELCTEYLTERIQVINENIETCEKLSATLSLFIKGANIELKD